MLANDGAWNGQQIVPRQWLLDATTVPRDSYLRNTIAQSWGYGYQVWILPGERRMILLLGIHGQGLFVDPESKLIMVQTAVRKLPVGNPEIAGSHGLVVCGRGAIRASLALQAARPSRVKLGNTQREQMTSAVHPTTDIAKILRHFRFVPIPEVGSKDARRRRSLTPEVRASRPLAMRSSLIRVIRRGATA